MCSTVNTTTGMSATPNLGDELKSSPYIIKRVANDIYAQNLYAALCNMRWRKLDAWAILNDRALWGASWRGAGRLVSEIRSQGDYMDWYCSGLVTGYDDERVAGYLPEGTVSREIAHDLRQLGWVPVEYDKED